MNEDCGRLSTVSFSDNYLSGLLELRFLILEFGSVEL